MKKLIIAIILTFVFYNSGHSTRIITNFDIARWYLDADVVLICNVNQTDTLTVAKFDSLLADGFHLRYDVLREKYHCSVDSILKGEQTTDTIFTPEFSSSSRREKKEFTGFNAEGDSTFLLTVQYNTDFNDDSWFRIKSAEKRLVILRESEIGYVIDYQSKCDSSLLNLIQQVELKGEDYFNWLSSRTIDSGNFRIYPNPFTDVVQIKGIEAKRIEITDINGKTKKVMVQDPNYVDLSHLKSGMYVISVFTDKNKWTQKIVKE